jgi:hypothetical protein
MELPSDREHPPSEAGRPYPESRSQNLESSQVAFVIRHGVNRKKSCIFKNGRSDYYLIHGKTLCIDFCLAALASQSLGRIGKLPKYQKSMHEKSGPIVARCLGAAY